MLSIRFAGTYLLATFATLVNAQSRGYEGYNLRETGDEVSATYSTKGNPANVSVSWPEPDVYLHAVVHVGEIDINVSNLTAKINLDAQVRSLLQFNAGVDLSIDRVSLIIQEVNAEVHLEARLANLVIMIDDVLKSLDLNPIIATLGSGIQNVTGSVGDAVGQIGETLGGVLGGSGGSNDTAQIAKRGEPLSYNIANNILYSVNDYRGNTHTNRVLAQNGSLVDVSLDNDGNVTGDRFVGDYRYDMRFRDSSPSSGRAVNGRTVDRELEYVYEPFAGLVTVCEIYVDEAGSVLGTKVLSEASGGASSTVGGESEL